MVSFQCDGCADTVKKPKLDQHRQRCHAPFTCLDCSTTFRGTDYKSHTSCISEAEKYQGALYKGNKKGKQPQSNIPTPLEVPPPTSIPSSQPTSPPGIHPSRLAVIESGPSTSSTSYGASDSYRGRGGFQRGRGGARGGFGGRGGYGAQANGWGGGGGFVQKIAVTGENKVVSKEGMRSWGTNTPLEGTPQPTAPAADQQTASVPATAIVAEASTSKILNGEKEKKVKKRKGDKGGTGSKANSSKGKESQPESSLDARPIAVPEVSNDIDVKVGEVTKEKSKDKKRKRDSTTVDSIQEAIPEKSLKRLKKNWSKLSATSSITSLNDLVDQLSKSKKESLGQEDVLKGLKVEEKDGQWILSI